MTENGWLLIGFNLFVVAMLALDLGVFHRKEHVVKVREALAWSAVWISLALSFNVFIYFWKGQEAALQFLAGYLIEESLSVDNLFVFLLIFSYFKVDAKVQYKVLFWGILGAALMRASLIVVGAALIREFHWVMYVFGVFLLVTGIKMGLPGSDEDSLDPGKNPMVRLVRRFLPVTEDYVGDAFFVRQGRKLFATPLFIVLIVVETTDLVFALDSIPAIFAVTTDPVIVYTSNIFAILGLRSLYFALAGMMEIFHYLKYGLAAVLSFIGIKMLVASIFPIPIAVALGVVAGILAFSVLASISWPPSPARADSGDGP